jgi:hypothetical protein
MARIKTSNIKSYPLPPLYEDVDLVRTPFEKVAPTYSIATAPSTSPATGSLTSVQYPIGSFDTIQNSNKAETASLINSSFLRALITPREMLWVASGGNSFVFYPVPEKYTELLTSYQYSIKNSRGIDIMFTPENIPSDSFGNDYGASFLANIMDVFKGSLSDLAQGMNTHSLSGEISAASEMIKGEGDNGFFKNLIGEMMSKLGTTAASIEARAGQAQQTGEKGFTGLAAKMISSAGAMLAGGRVDFPSVWKDSSFTPSCSITIKLYNPYPGNIEATRKYITGPLCALLLLALPRYVPVQGSQGTGVSTYSWPFFCSIECPGVFNMPFSAVSNISIQKVPEQQIIASNQLVPQINVTMDFISLYPTMIAGGKDANLDNRLNLGMYLDNLLYAAEKGVVIETTNKIPVGVTPLSESPPVPPASRKNSDRSALLNRLINR